MPPPLTPLPALTPPTLLPRPVAPPVVVVDPRVAAAVGAPPEGVGMSEPLAGST